MLLVALQLVLCAVAAGMVVGAVRAIRRQRAVRRTLLPTATPPPPPPPAPAAAHPRGDGYYELVRRGYAPWVHWFDARLSRHELVILRWKLSVERPTNGLCNRHGHAHFIQRRCPQHGSHIDCIHCLVEAHPPQAVS